MNKNLSAGPSKLWLMAIMVMLALALAATSVRGAVLVKANNNLDLNLAASWVSAIVPGSGDVATWDNTFLAANNNAALGTNMTWSGILFSNNLATGFTINATGTNALTLGTVGINLSNANSSLTMNCPVIQGGNETWIVNAGQSLTFGGAVTGGAPTANSQYNLTMLGTGTINFNGNYSDTLNNFAQGQNFLINSNTVNINPGTTGSFVTSKKTIIGNIAGSVTTLNIQSGTNVFGATNYVVMCDNASATAVLNITGGQTTFANSVQSFANALKGTGVVNVANATVIFSPVTRVAIGSDQANGFTGADGTLNINSGSMVIASSGSGYFSLGNGGGASFGKGRLYLNSGGTFICGRNIVKNQANASGFVTFNGGTLRAGLTSTTFLQGLTMTTISTNGGTIDDGGFFVTVAQPLLHDVTLATDGGLTKLGNGTLTLSGATNGIYNGPTIVGAGTLAVVTTNGLSALGAGPCAVSNGATLWLKSAAGNTAGVAALTLNAGSSLLLDAPTLTAPFLNATNAVTSSSAVIVNLTNLTIAIGQYPLIKYGTLGGAGVGGFAIGSTPLAPGLSFSLSNNAANQSIDLLVKATVSTATWDGTVSGVWDIGGAANWQTGAFYTEPGGVGPLTTFDDSAAGPNTAITLNTTVSPTSITVSNANLTYSISGSGHIAGGGGLSKQGSGTLIVATANTMTNLTSILGGTLQLGDGTANNGNVGGNIVDNSALIIANPNPQIMNTFISGNGTLTKSGVGSLTLTSSNTVSGVVSVTAGTLALNPGGAGGNVPVLGFVPSVNIASGSTLALTGSNALGLTNAVRPAITIAGGGALNTIGSGTHTVGGLTLGDNSGGGVMSGPGNVVVNATYFTNYAGSTINLPLTLGSSAVTCTNVFFAGSSALTLVSNLTITAPAASSLTILNGDPGGSGATLTTAGNVAVNNSLELEYLTWNVQLGTNSFNMRGKLTIGKIPGLPAVMKWISGTGLYSPNDYFAIGDSIGNNPGSIGELDVLGGNLVISNTAARCLIGNAGSGTINVSAGSLSFMGPVPIELGGDTSFSQNNASGTLTISDSGSFTVGPLSGGLRVAAANGSSTGITGTINLNGGTLTTWPGIANGYAGGGVSSYINFNGGTLKAGTNNNTFLQGLTTATVQSGGAIIDDGGNNITIGQALTDGGGGLTKLGSGVLVLTNASTYSGQTTVSNGTLVVNGGIAGSGVSAVQGRLGGLGVIAAPVTIHSGATLSPGTNGFGTLTINGDLSLNGSVAVAVNKGTAQSNGLTVVSGTLVNTGSGTVTVTNIGTALAVGDTFQLFSQAVVNGNVLTILPSGAVTWTNLLAVDGTIQVLSVAPSINPLPGVIQQNFTAGVFSLSWPTNLGWILQTQTNQLGTGLNTNWVNVPGSDTLTNINLIPNSANGTVFYRLVHP